MAAPPDRHGFRYFDGTALPYDRSEAPTNEVPAWIDGQNVLTSISGYAERRPGFAQYGSTTFDAGSVIRNIFTWQKWGGTFIVVVNTTNAGTGASKVYKREIGTDADFVLLYTGASNAQPFFFVTSNDYMYAMSGGLGGANSGIFKWSGSGTTTQNWGITDPASAATFTTAAGALTLLFGRKYVYCFKNSVTGHMGSPAPVSVSTGAITAQVVNLDGLRSADAQVDKIAIFGTTDGGSGLYFELPNSPIANPGAGNWTYADSATDLQLKATVAPQTGYNAVPAGNCRWPTWFANRIWFAGSNTNPVPTAVDRADTVYYTGWEEIDNGVEEESVPPSNTFRFPQAVTGLAVAGSRLLVYTAGGVYPIDGDSLDTFRRGSRLFAGMGLHEQQALCNIGTSVAWLDSRNKVRVTNGFTQEDISKPIWADIASITHANSSMTHHSDNKREWILLSDGVKIWAFDVMQARWMPPWVVPVRAMHSGETAAGSWSLFVGNTSRKVLTLTPTTYVDDGATYTAFAVLNPLRTTAGEPGRLGDLEYVSVERNSVALSDMKVLTDEDPATGTYVSINANKVAAPLRTAGTNLVEEWFYHRTPAARRVSVRFDWAAASTNFILYTFGIAAQELQK